MKPQAYINRLKQAAKHNQYYILSSLRWLVLSSLTGLIVGAFSSAFSWCMTTATNLRLAHDWLLFLLPIGGLVIVFFYHIAHMENDKGTNQVLTAVRGVNNIPFRLAPLIFGSTVITHLFGGSAGREGAALQLGGSIGDKIGRVFRNEGLDTRHNPEFTLMELYQAYTDYHGMMDLTENLYRYVAQEVLGTTKIVYNGIEMDLGKPFARMTMTEAVKKYAGVDFDKIHTLEEARDAAKEHHVEFETRHKKGEILNLFFEQFCEEHMIQPTFIMDHPTDISPLTKMKPDNPEYVERFEFFMNGWEMANAYSELNDPIDQRRRFALQEEQFAAGDEEANHTDEDFLNALEIGMPPTGGIGFGIDRMCMLLTDSQAIRDVLLFPTMKRQGKKENGETEDEEE